MKTYKYFDLLMAAFVAVLLISNVSSSAKIVDWGMSLRGIKLAFDGGTLLFPISYIFGDVLTEVYGYKRARRVIWSGFGALILMSACIYMIQVMPGESEWQNYAGDEAFLAILGGISSGGIVIASLSAYLLGEFCNSVVLAKIKISMKGKHLWVRTIGSTLLGQAIDTGTFVCIACAFGVFPWSIAVSLLLSNYIFKVAIEVLLTPLTYKVIGFLKKAEQEDYDDSHTNFSPFHLSV